MKICADCIHEYACAMWNNGNIHNMDATRCPTYEDLRESPVYLMGLLDRKEEIITNGGGLTMADLIDRETLLSRIDHDEYYHSNEVRDMVEDCPAVDAVPKAAYDQVVWERDMAIQQLREDYGVELGEKKHAGAKMDLEADHGEA